MINYNTIYTATNVLSYYVCACITAYILAYKNNGKKRNKNLLTLAYFDFIVLQWEKKSSFIINRHHFMLL